MNRTPAATSHRTVPFRGRTTILALGFPLAVVAATAAIAWSWRSELPDPIAVHWGTNGPDGFGGFSSHVLGLTIVPVATSILLWALGCFAGRASFTRRIAVGMSVWFALFFTGIDLATLTVQRGVADARDAGSISTPLAIVFVVAASAAAAAAWLSPADPRLPTTRLVPPTAARLELRPGELATWTRDITFRSFVGSVAAVVAGVAIIGLISHAWVLAVVVGLLIGLSLAFFTQWTVSVDDAGLEVRSALGRPRFIIPLDEVEMAEVVQVRPLAEFGGWGIRSGKGGRVGVIIHAGPALQVHRSGGRIFLVTVDDAGAGAALLNTLAERARS